MGRFCCLMPLARTKMRHLRRLSLLAALTGALLAPQPASAALREYWVAAVPQLGWNVVPNGQDAVSGTQFDPATTTFDTVAYRRFTPHWQKMLPAEYGGIPGPTIHARVGDVISVHFLNLDLNTAHSMHFHGVHYAFGSDGSYIPGFSGPGANVKPGRSFTYRLVAGADSRGVWSYHDHSPSMMDSIQGGLYGAVSILGRRERAPDREFVVFLESMGGFMTIDGRAFIGNTPVFHARVGDLVQWDVLALGDEQHTFHVHGHRWLEHGVPLDVKTIGPAESFRIRWREDRSGTWYYHCHVEAHMADGMIGLYRVSPR
jgi:FtsP/CotA-like multicopper oxidase with cupredoxin domain